MVVTGIFWLRTSDTPVAKNGLPKRSSNFGGCTAELRACKMCPGCVFFFQAEDGIRDYKVTGVQTCALPISALEEILAGRFSSSERVMLDVVLERNGTIIERQAVVNEACINKGALARMIDLKDRKSVV